MSLESNNSYPVESIQDEYVIATPENVIAALTHALSAERHAATHDNLTGLLNREGLDRAFTERYEGTNKRAIVTKFDVLNFKAANDRLGEAGGDLVLMELSDIFTNSTRHDKETGRSEDLIARIGGDEFVIVSDAPEDQLEAERIGDTIRDRVNTAVELFINGIPELNENQDVKCHVSSGFNIGEIGESLKSISAGAYDEMHIHKEIQQETHGQYRIAG